MDPPATPDPVPETKTPAPATPAPAPAPATPAPVVTPAPAPKSEPAPEPALTNESPVDYTRADGTPAQTTMGQLIEDREKLAALDLEQIETLQGAMRNEPEAQRKLLQGELDKLTPTPATDEATAGIVTALTDRLSQVEQRLGRSDRVVQAAEDQEFSKTLTGVLDNAQVKERYPVFAAHPGVAHSVLGRHMRVARAVANGTPITNQALGQAFQRAAEEMTYLASEYIPESAPAAAPGTPVVAPVAAASGQVVQSAQVTGAQLLEQAQAAAAASPNIPTPGGVPGTGVAVPPPAASGPVTRDAFLERIKAQVTTGAAQ